jgi:hypothetical protein
VKRKGLYYLKIEEMSTFFEPIGLITGVGGWHESGWRDRHAVAPFVACDRRRIRRAVPQGGPVQAA